MHKMPSNSEKLANIKVNEEMPARPLGFYVLVEVVEVETESSSGIYMGKQEREQSAEEVGYLRAIGPTAYHGWEGCQSGKVQRIVEHEGKNVIANANVLPYQRWGLNIGDMVEFRAYEGKRCVIPGYERWRYIPDSHIVAVINEVKEDPKKYSGIAKTKDEGQLISESEEYS